MIKANERSVHQWPTDVDDQWRKCVPLTVGDLRRAIADLSDSRKIVLSIAVPVAEKPAFGLKDQAHGEIVISDVAFNTGTGVFVIGAWLPTN